MKNLYSFLGIILVCFGILSGCKTLSDVVPSKAIYSPIELDASLIPLRTRVTSFTLNVNETACKIQFKGNDATLSYGALVFYDSVAAASFVLERKIIGQVQSVSAVFSSTSKIVISDTVKFDNTKGQYIYITPYAYKKEDSLSIRTNSYSKVFSSKGYMQLKISPWTHFADIPPPTTSIYQSINLIQGTDKLSYLKYTQSIVLNSNPLYEYDSIAHRWGDKVGAIPTTLIIPSYKGDNYGIKKDIFLLNSVFYQNSKYHIICSLYSREYDKTYDVAKHSMSIITLPKDSIITQNKIFTPEEISQFSFGINLPSGYISHSIFNMGEIGIFANINQDPSYKLSLYIRPNNSTSVSEVYLPDIFNKTFFNRPTIALYIDNKYVFNTNNDQTNFAVLKTNGVSSVTVLQQNKIIVPDALYGSFNGESKSFICLSNGAQGYVISKNQVIHKVTLDTREFKPKFENIYQGWFPGNGSSSIIQGIMYKGQLAFLLDNYEVWLFDPSKLSIEFDPSKRPGAFNIVNL